MSIQEIAEQLWKDVDFHLEFRPTQTAKELTIQAMAQTLRNVPVEPGEDALVLQTLEAMAAIDARTNWTAIADRYWLCMAQQQDNKNEMKCPICKGWIEAIGYAGQEKTVVFECKCGMHLESNISRATWLGSARKALGGG